MGKDIYKWILSFILFAQITNAQLLQVTVVETNQKIILNWGQYVENYEAVESYDYLGYKFEGYNIYQFPNENSITKKEAVLIENFDLVNGVREITENIFNPTTGLIESVVVQHGNDNGITRRIDITQDAFSRSSLKNDVEYYFAVTAYSYNKDAVPQQIETQIIVIKATPTEFKPIDNPDFVPGDLLDVTHTGTSSASVIVEVVDPDKMVERNYEIYFNEQLKYKDLDGIWKNASDRNVSLGKDASGSKMELLAVTDYENPSQIKIIGNLVADAGNNWIDGVKLIFPTGTIINSAEDMHYLIPDAYGEESLNPDAVPTPIIHGQTVTWGGDFADGWGAYMGGEEFVMYVARPVQLPMEIGYEIYDDMFDDTKVDAIGSVNIDVVVPEYRVENHWNLKDASAGLDLIEDQEVINGVELYEPIFGYGSEYAPEVHGFKVKVNGTYTIPTDFNYFSVIRDNSLIIKEQVPFTQSDFNMNGNYQIMSMASAGWSQRNETATSVDCMLGAGHEYLGTTDLDLLQADIELRFTGEYEMGVDSAGYPIPNADGHILIKEGTGSVATIIAARGYDMNNSLADYPLNPNPGLDESFTLRIPFEVWDTENNKQINILVVDRIQGLNTTPFYAFNEINRMYTVFCHTDYNENVNDYEDNADFLTWTLVFWPLGRWQTGDIVKLNYSNPIRHGIDKFTFSTIQPVSVNDATPEKFSLSQNYPNPFNPVTNIQFQLTESGMVKLSVFNLLGQKVEELINTRLDAGNHNVQFNGNAYASGVYFYRLETKNFTETKKMMLLK